MSDQSQSSMIQPTTQSVPAKTKVSKVSLTMMMGYILAGLFLIGTIVVIILYIKKKSSGHATLCLSGDDFAVCDSNGVCTCDCKKTCTSDNNVIYNTSNNICNINTDKVCPSIINGKETGLQWNKDKNECEVLEKFDDINCPVDCNLGSLCPLGTYSKLYTNSKMSNNSFELNYDPRLSQAEEGKCYAPDGLFETHNDLRNWCVTSNFIPTFFPQPSLSYCQPTYGCNTIKDDSGKRVCERVNPDTQCKFFVNDPTCGGDNCSKNGTCSFKSEITHLTYDQSFSPSKNRQFYGSEWNKKVDIFGNWTYRCFSGNYYFSHTKDNMTTYWCMSSDVCSNIKNQKDCTAVTDICKWC